MSSVGKVHFLHELVQSSFFPICCYQPLLFKIIATAHIEPQTAIIFNTETAALRQYTANPGCPAAAVR